MSRKTTCARCDQPRVGAHALCREHRNAYMREWYARNPDKMAERNRKRREADWRTRGGMTHDDYAAMLAKQGGGCAICGLPEPDNRHGRLDVDHDHVTGAVRGLLCTGCNTALGLLKDDVARLRAAIDYLGGAYE